MMNKTKILLFTVIALFPISFSQHKIALGAEPISWPEAAKGTWLGTVEFSSPQGKKQIELSLTIKPKPAGANPSTEWEMTLAYQGQPPRNSVLRRDRPSSEPNPNPLTRPGQGHWVIDEGNRIEIDAFELPGPTLSTMYYIKDQLYSVRYMILGNRLLITSESINPAQPLSKTGGNGGPEIYNYAFSSSQYGSLARQN